MTGGSICLTGIEPDELIVDNFAGGGGASAGIEAALGRPIDIAINHDPEAIAMHTMNHPSTLHLCESVWKVDIRAVVAGRRVGLAWFSPDCKHFSKAKGGKPVEKKIRGLAWVALRWAGLVKPRVICLENVEEFQTWGPVVNGKPCPRRKGMTFKRWVTQLRNLGYEVQWRKLKACDYGAPTIRKRLFVIARRDGLPIVWPEETHGAPGSLFPKPYRTAAECIDWSIPCPSIFLTKEEGRAIGVNRPLAEATMRRIARGVKRYVIDAAEPFIVSLTHHGADRVESIHEPFRTLTGAHRGEKALVTPFLAGLGGRMGQSPERTASDPYHTITAKADTALVAVFLAKHFGGHETPGADARDPMATVTSADHHALVSSHLVKLRGTCRDGQPTDEPVATISAQGTHLGEVRAFLLKYYSTDQSPQLTEPMHTLTTKHRIGLVTVHGQDYVIADIGMRMLTPRELFRAQGFPESYIIDRGRDVQTGREVKLTKTAQVRMCGNSVSPPAAEAIVRAQFGVTAEHEEAA